MSSAERPRPHSVLGPSIRRARPAALTPALSPALEADTDPPPRARRRTRSLFWWVLSTNGAVLLVAVLLLAATPITIDAPIKAEQLAILSIGFFVLLALNVVLLRRVLAPLVRLTDVMSSVDPDRPGRRLSGVEPRSAEGQALARSFNDMLDRLESARHGAARTALAAQEAERIRVARELHDEIGQTLTAVAIEAGRAARTEPALAQQALLDLADGVRGSLDEVRRIARELRPEALDDLGLVNALIALCTRAAAGHELEVRRDLQAELPPLSQEVELVIYRVAQEALTNTLRHSGARTVTVSLVADADTVTLRVTDDGRGMPAHVPGDAAGIAGMRERALLVGGVLSVGSGAGGGTEVKLMVPIAEDRA